LADLLRDQSERWQRGEPVRAEHYLETTPTLRANAEAVLDLIFHEVLLREQQGETPQLDEYVRRFPHLAGPLRRQFAIDRALFAQRLSQSPKRGQTP
jgi:hypothetical protein